MRFKIYIIILIGMINYSLIGLVNYSYARKELIYEEIFGTYRFLYSVPNETKKPFAAKIFGGIIGAAILSHAKYYLPTSNYPMNIVKVFDTSYEKIWNSILKVVEILKGKVIVKDKSSGIIVFVYPEKIKWKYLKEYYYKYYSEKEYFRKWHFFYSYPYREKYVIIKPKAVFNPIDSIKFPIYLNLYIKKETNKTKIYLTYFIPFLDVPCNKYIDIDFLKMLENILKKI